MAKRGDVQEHEIEHEGNRRAHGHYADFILAMSRASERSDVG